MNVGDRVESTVSGLRATVVEWPKYKWGEKPEDAAAIRWDIDGVLAPVPESNLRSIDER